MRADAGAATSARRPPLRVLLSAAAVVALVAGLLLIGGRAAVGLMRFHDTGLPGHLTLATDWRSDMLDVAPGEQGHWIIHATLRDEERGALDVRIRSVGDLSEIDPGVLLQLDRCDREWAVPPGAAPDAAPVCSVGSVPVLPPTPLSAFRDGPAAMPLPDITAARGEHLLLTSTIDSSRSGDERLMGRTGTIAVGVTASGGDPEVGPVAGGVLPRTGGTADIGALLLIGLGALGLGLMTRGAGTRRERAAAVVATATATATDPDARA
ncbi:hypothetical protein ACR8AL_05265 [Clavibacter sepedonicus]|uniref:Sortase-sorted surface-anchored protein n=1 Tax=Clavibacter sepedonicus TaxID=31964 RepID=B0RCC3_CLASE|nr:MULTISPECIES: hypothetical protein [Clavibacter]MBD5380553.1 hypothetical protein [Clavibacter sp.]OQJ53998.1 hypothetical protein B5P20_07630 [Clavibacter sepedonicus]UUK65529.1 hypothetical protein LRE50_14855 [Clavibacter sepedonicus]CAQ03011.1 putative sortase-sorted surface-anchored protein [Clavibacter sepedonicus]